MLRHTVFIFNCPATCIFIRHLKLNHLFAAFEIRETNALTLYYTKWRGVHYFFFLPCRNKLAALAVHVHHCLFSQ